MAPSSSHDESKARLEIAHVLFMDIVAFSRLPMEEQTRLLVELQSVVRSSSEFQRAEADDQLIRLPTGDGMALIFFGDPESAVRCAVETSRALSEEPELKLRMGIHSGPVQRIDDINAGRNVSGAGINYAQRVMDCGDAGHILVSRAVADVIGETSRWGAALHDLGEVEVKHGAQLRLYNLHGEGFGAGVLPEIVRTQRERAAQTGKEQARARGRRRRLSLIVIAAGVLAAIAVSGIFYARRAHALTDKDTVVVADFENKTGDKVFDDTLKQGLAVSLSQSPFLALVADQKLNATLKMMGRAPGEPITGELAREMCMRVGSKAMLAGSIASLGQQYVIGLKAVHCRDGDVLAQEQEHADNKEGVLQSLDRAAKSLREKLGESLVARQKYDRPLEEATTSSLEALQAYSTGRKVGLQKGDIDSIAYYQRAVDLDPNFAMAYAALAVSYSNLGQGTRASDTARKAFQFRDRVSEREKYRIAGFYYTLSTGELDKANREYEEWKENYPRDYLAPGDLGDNYMRLGEWEKALHETQDAIRIEPNIAAFQSNLGWTELALGRIDEARATLEEARARQLDSHLLRLAMFAVGFLGGDKAAMQQQVGWASGRAGEEDWLLSAESDTNAYEGRLTRARELSKQAAESARHADVKDAAALWQADAALREAEFGNAAVARRDALTALELAPGREVRSVAALAIARTGDTSQAQKMVEALEKDFPVNTVVQGYWLPSIRAAIALNRGDPARAVSVLGEATRYELGQCQPFQFGMMYPVYLRGQAYLHMRRGKEAEMEFQRILEHNGIVLNFPTGALARLNLGRAYALSGDTAGARSRYNEFLHLWKDADPDIPILKQAKAEYAKLQ
jgi:eukaryotic-like serine/threonine-protein kinase